jgi:hypothetical protein
VKCVRLMTWVAVLVTLSPAHRCVCVCVCVCVCERERERERASERERVYKQYYNIYIIYINNDSYVI